MAEDSCDDLFACFTINDEDGDKNIEPQCREMCPREEMLFREANGLLGRLELTDPRTENWQRYRSSVASKSGSRGSSSYGRRGQQQQQQSHVSFTDSNRAVKQFRRSSAGQSLTIPADLRPSAVLRATVDYLLTELPLNHLPKLGETCSSLLQFATFYDFVFDRLRAVRQDMVVQRLLDANCLHILERCIEFYAYSHYTYLQLMTIKSSTADLRQLSASFDAHLNRVHLGECFQLLLLHYDHFNSLNESRALFEATYLVFNFTSGGQPNSDALKRYQRLKRSSQADLLFTYPLMKTATRVLLASLLGNHIRTLRLVAEQYSDIQSQLFAIVFAVSGSLSSVHLALLKLLTAAYRSPTTALPVTTLAIDWFCPFSDNELAVSDYLERLAGHYGVLVMEEQEVANGTKKTVDYFNYNSTEEDLSVNTKKKMLVIKTKMTTEHWQPPSTASGGVHLSLPLGWLSNTHLPLVYRNFLVPK